MSLEQSRRDTADEIYINFDFSYHVEDADGWTSEFNGHVFKKVVYLNPDDKEVEGTLRAEFAVRFEDGTNIPFEAVCFLNGEKIGNIMGGTLEDYIVDEESDAATHFDDVDESLYGDVECGILLSSDEYGHEIFVYDNDDERRDAIARLHDSVVEVGDEIERDVAFVTNGELTYVGSFDGTDWSHYELPSAEAKASV